MPSLRSLTIDQHMRVTDGPCGQAPLGHMLIHGLKIQRSQGGQNSFTESGSDVPVQHAPIILEGFGGVLSVLRLSQAIGQGIRSP
jgi:hypothetical protein